MASGGDDTRIGDKIAAARREVGLTQAELGELLRVNPSAIGQWETHRRKPSIEQRINLAKHLGIPFHELLPQGAADLPEEPLSDPLERRLIDAFRASAPAVRESILMVATLGADAARHEQDKP